jgi:hypothetical protein
VVTKVFENAGQRASKLNSSLGKKELSYVNQIKRSLGFNSLSYNAKARF